VDIAVPNALHAEIAILAAQAGKMIWCEKPLAMSVDEARQMADAVCGKWNLVWFNYRCVPAVAFARELIDAGKLVSRSSIVRTTSILRERISPKATRGAIAAPRLDQERLEISFRIPSIWRSI